MFDYLSVSSPVLRFIRNHELDERASRAVYMAVEQFREDASQFFERYKEPHAQELWALCIALSVRYRWRGAYRIETLESETTFATRYPRARVNTIYQTKDIDQTRVADRFETVEQLIHVRDCYIEGVLRAMSVPAGAKFLAWAMARIETVETCDRAFPTQRLLVHTQWRAVLQAPGKPYQPIIIDEPVTL